MSASKISHRILFDVWLSNLKEDRCDKICNFITMNFSSGSTTTIDFDKLKHFLGVYVQNLKENGQKRIE